MQSISICNSINYKHNKLYAGNNRRLFKYSEFLVLIFFLFAGISYSQTATTPSGSGTSGSLYLIASLNNLYWITQNQVHGDHILDKQQI